MKCSVCGCGLANDLKGREAHMKKYHAVTLEAPKPKAYVPMDPKEKAEKIARMEARLASKIVLDEKGDFKAYGEPLKAAAPVLEEWPTTDFGFEPRMVTLPERNVAPDKNCVTVENGDCVAENPCMHSPKVEKPVYDQVEWSTPITSWEEFNRRLDALVVQSDDTLAQMKKVFGE